MSGDATAGGGSDGGGPDSGGSAATAAQPAGNKGFAAFRSRDFCFFIAGKSLAQLVIFMIAVAVSYQVYDMTGDAMNLAYVGLSIFAPTLGFALVTGYVADRFERKLVLAVCYLVLGLSGVGLAVFTLSGTTELWPVFAMLMLFGTGRAFYMPAHNAILPNLVTTEVFPNAVAWNTSTNKLGQVLGPALGGGLYLLGPEVVYITAVCIGILSATLTVMIRRRLVTEGRQPVSLGVLLAGVGYVWRTKVVLGAITLDLFVVLISSVTALLPIFAKDILDVGAAGAGALRSAIAAGGVVTALAMTQVSMTRRVGSIMFATVTLFGVVTVAFGLSTWFWLSMLALAVLGAADMISIYIRQTLIQIATPDEMRGRVSAVNSVFIASSNELGDVRAGLVAAWIGAVPAAVIGGVAAVVISGICWKLFPELARVERMDRVLQTP